MRQLQQMLVGGMAALAGATSAYAQSAPSMPLGRQVSAPAGYVAFCAREPSECREFAGRGPQDVSPLSAFWRDAFSERTSAVGVTEPGHGPAPRLSLTHDTVALLNDVNRGVNGAIAPVNDRDADLWSLPLAEGRRTGDCEDYVLEKRRALIARGLPAETLSIAVVRTPQGENHAVLVAATEAGEMVLDNRTPWIMAWNQTGYRWVKRQSPVDPAAWVRVASY